jgi:hypothetical protein
MHAVHRDVTLQGLGAGKGGLMKGVAERARPFGTRFAFFFASVPV